MKPLTWHGKSDIPCESVPDPRIEDSRDVADGYDWSDRFRPFASYMNELSQARPRFGRGGRRADASGPPDFMGLSCAAPIC